MKIQKVILLSSLLITGTVFTKIGLGTNPVIALENKTRIEIENSASAGAAAGSACEVEGEGRCATASVAGASVETTTKVVHESNTVETQPIIQPVSQVASSNRVVYHKPANTSLASFTPGVALTAMAPGLLALVVKLKQLA